MILLFVLVLSSANGHPSFPVGNENYIILNGMESFPFGNDNGLANWNSFLLYFYRLSDPCDSQGLEVNLRVPNGDYLPATRGRVGCSITKDSLENIVRKLADDTLIFRLPDNKCRKVTFVYQNSDGAESVLERDPEEYSCNELLSPEEIKTRSNAVQASTSDVEVPPPPQPNSLPVETQTSTPPAPSPSEPPTVSEKKPPPPAKTTVTGRYDDELTR